MTDSGFDEYVGISAYEGTYVPKHFCLCADGDYGPTCDKTLKEFEDGTDCGENGIFDSRNSVTGCSCRKKINGTATEYHGWYCERHNRFEILIFSYFSRCGTLILI